jgi:hypothetical protein
MAEAPIRLMAKDAEDLAVVASCLQDALASLADMQYLKAEQRFVMLLNRFRWERRAQGEKPGDASFADADSNGDERINSGLCVDRVVAVRSRGLDRHKPGKFLALMTMGLATVGTEGPNTLNFLFSGGGVLQLEIEGLSVFLQDFGEGWPTQWRPDHVLDGPAAKGRG